MCYTLARTGPPLHTGSSFEIPFRDSRVTGMRWTIGVVGLVASLAGCSDTPTTATGPQSAPLGPVDPPSVRYRLVLLDADTTSMDGNTVLLVRMEVRTQEGGGGSVASAAVDVGATAGSVYPTRTTTERGGTVTVVWWIPPGPLVAYFYGCARPIGQSCTNGPLFKWNQ